MQLSLTQLLSEAARRWGRHTAVVDSAVVDTAVEKAQQHLTYDSLFELSLRYAGALRAEGVRPGQRVALILPNTKDFPALYFAVLNLGAVVVPINTRLTAVEVGAILVASGAHIVVADGSTHATAAAAIRPSRHRLLLVSAADAQPAQRLETIAASVPPLHSPAQAQADDVAVVMYTSGTTGRPKGAMLTHGNLVLNAMVCARDVCAYTPDDVVLGALPLAHSFGQTVVQNAAICAGAAVVMLDHFTGRDALALIERHAVTVFSGVPTMYSGLLDAARTAPRLPWLRLATSGGASLPAAVLEEFAQRFGSDILEGYGLTETSPAATFNQAEFGRRAGSIGHPIWGLDVEIADPEVTDRIVRLGVDEIGELVVRGHAVFAGYLDDPEATAAAFTGDWLRTGDLGTKDEDGFIRIVARKKDLIIRGGYNVYPREVEEVLGGHPAVDQVAVVGIAHPHYGEEVVACVVPRIPLDAAGLGEIVGWARQRLAGYKCPTQVHPMADLPTGPSGKVLKRELGRRVQALNERKAAL